MDDTLSSSLPAGKEEVTEQEQKREYCAAGFREAAERDDFAGMYACYDRIWNLPLTEDNSLQMWMNRELMSRCRLPGVYYPGNGIEIVIRGHDPEDPIPYRVRGMFPLPQFHTGNTFFDEMPWPAGYAFRDELEKSFWYFPGDGETDGVKILIWDKREQKLSEHFIRLDIGSRYVHRVIACGSQGLLLILELREKENRYGESSRDDPFALVCVSTNGRWSAEILSDFGRREDGPIRAVFLEDGRYSPNRGYLWLPYTRKIVYFEQDRESFYLYDNPAELKHRQYSFPMPEEVFPDDSFDPHWRTPFTRETVESVVLSVDGEGIAMITLEEMRGGNGKTDRIRMGKFLYLYSKETASWNRYPFGETAQILLTRDLRYILVGKKTEIGETHWYWQLFPADVKKGQKPLWKLRENVPETRIAAFSYDLCSLLDQKGRPVYAVCWDYLQHS